MKLTNEKQPTATPSTSSPEPPKRLSSNLLMVCSRPKNVSELTSWPYAFSTEIEQLYPGQLVKVNDERTIICICKEKIILNKPRSSANFKHMSPLYRGKKDTILHLGLQVFFNIERYKNGAFIVVSILVTRKLCSLWWNESYWRSFYHVLSLYLFSPLSEHWSTTCSLLIIRSSLMLTKKDTESFIWT